MAVVRSCVRRASDRLLQSCQLTLGEGRNPRTRQCVRAALGASQVRLFQASLAESFLLCASGGVAGVLLAFLGVRLFIAIAPANLPRLAEVHTSWPILVFAAALSILTAFLFGSFSAFRSLRADPQRVLVSGSGRLSDTPGALGIRRLLVTFEIARTVVLLICTALIGRSFSKILGQNRAFTAAHLTMAQVELLSQRYNQTDESAAVRATFIDHALNRLRENPKVQFAAITSTMPLTGKAKIYSIYRPDRPLPESKLPQANLRNISTDYFAAMQIPLVAGADFGKTEPNHPEHAIVSQNAARAAWPGEEALGRKFRINGGIYTVVGIAADARINDLKEDAERRCTYCLSALLARSALDGFFPDSLAAIDRGTRFNHPARPLGCRP